MHTPVNTRLKCLLERYYNKKTVNQMVNSFQFISYIIQKINTTSKVGLVMRKHVLAYMCKNCLCLYNADVGCLYSIISSF